MDATRSFRFSTNTFGLRSGADFVAYCRRVEELEYDTLFAADHLGSTAPFQMLVAAAAATSRLRLGTLVLNVPFWNPALLAREIVTADVLTGGRLEVGLGSGHMKWEFDEAGITFEPFGARADRLEATIAEIGVILAAGGYQQRRALEEHTAEETDAVVGFARSQAGDRADAVEWNVLVQLVKVTDDRLSVAAEALAEDPDETMSAEEYLQSPFILIGTIDEIAAKILQHRDRYGFTYYTVHGPFAEEFSQVISYIRNNES